MKLQVQFSWGKFYILAPYVLIFTSGEWFTCTENKVCESWASEGFFSSGGSNRGFFQGWLKYFKGSYSGEISFYHLDT